jgi:chaperonin cofactor prefoldin
MPQQWANELSTVIKEKYSIEAIKAHLDSVLSELKC